MYRGNLLKYGYTNVQADEKRIIDANELIDRRRERQEELERYLASLESGSGEDGEADEDGFIPGLNAEEVEEPTSEEVREKADKIIEQTWARAKADCDKLRAETEAELAQEREETLEQARMQGYSEGMERANRELDAERAKLRQQLKEAEAEYQRLLNEMEPQFVETITGVYEHIFHVELSSYKEVLHYLITNAMQRIEGCRDFLIHVSQADYAAVRDQRGEIAAVVAPSCSVEIVEDITLSANECMIETESGIFDCGLGTQLEELGRKLRLLAYEK